MKRLERRQDHKKSSPAMLGEIPKPRSFESHPPPILPATPLKLGADLLIAENSLDATRQTIANNQMTNEEEKLIVAAALSRYAAALLRFCRLVLDGEVPSDLQ